MTRTQLRLKIGELILESNNMIWEKLEKLLKSGAIDLDSWEDDYRLPKHIMCAMGREISFQWKPLSDDKKAKKQIDQFYNMM